jgi:AcrR family transcriptional regulator
MITDIRSFYWKEKEKVMTNLTYQIPTKIKNENLVQKRRQQIILAAIKLIEKKGFHKTTLRDLSQKTKISLGNIYDYIGSKEDVVLLIHMFMANLVDLELNKIMETVDDPVQKLIQMIEAEFQIQCKWAGAILTIYRAAHLLKKNNLIKLFKREREHIERYEVVIKDCIKKGAFREVNVRVVVNLIKFVIDAWILCQWDLKGYADQSEMRKAIIDLSLNGLLKGKDLVLKDMGNKTRVRKLL